jgi:hypothetical protein
MKKLLLVLLVVTLASFLFVGCLPTTPAEGEGEGEAEICPTITITGQYAGTDRTFVKASSSAEVVVTYTLPTEGVSIYLVTTLAGSPFLLPYYLSADGLTYTASADLSGYSDCEIIMIEVVDCYGECTCVESFTVDYEEPYAKMMLTVPECVCGDCQIVITSDYTITGICADELGCCGDDCSGLASWAIDVYDVDPYDECCLIPCEEPIATCGTVACPIDCTTACVAGSTSVPSVPYYYILMSMLDNVGNENKYWARVTFDSGCNLSATDFKWWDAPNKAPTGSLTNACIDWALPGATFTTDVTSGGLRYFIFGECL